MPDDLRSPDRAGLDCLSVPFTLFASVFLSEALSEAAGLASSSRIVVFTDSTPDAFGVVALYRIVIPQESNATTIAAATTTVAILPVFGGSFLTLANTPDDTLLMVLRNLSAADGLSCSLSSAYDWLKRSPYERRGDGCLTTSASSRSSGVWSGATDSGASG